MRGNNNSTCNSKTCPILKLPGELRDAIYRYVVGDEKEVVLDRGLKDRFPCWSGSARPRAIIPPLLATCRQIRFEASKIYLEETTFVFDRASALDEWLGMLEPSGHGLVRRLVCDINIGQYGGIPYVTVRYELREAQKCMMKKGMDTKKCQLIARLYEEESQTLGELEELCAFAEEDDDDIDVRWKKDAQLVARTRN